MSIKKIETELMNKSYKVEDFKRVFNELIKLYESGDTSLCDEISLDTIIFSNDKEKVEYINNKNAKSFSKLLCNLMNMNIDNVSYNDVVEYTSLLEKINIFETRMYIPVMKVLDKFDFDFDEIINIVACLDRNNILTGYHILKIIKNLNNKEQLNKDNLKRLLDSIKDLDIFEEEVCVSLVTIFNNECIEVFSEYYIQIIDYLDENKLTNKMLERVLDSNYRLNVKTPELIKKNEKIIKILIKRDPNSIRTNLEFVKNEELLKLAKENGLQLSYNDFLEYGIFDEFILINELNLYFKNVSVSGNVIMRRILNKENEKENVVKISMLLKFALSNSIDIENVIRLINNENFSVLLSSIEENDPEFVNYICSNEKFIKSTIKSLGNSYANRILFEPDLDFSNKFYESGYCLNGFSSDYINNSRTMYENSLKYDAFQILNVMKYGNIDFLTKDFIDSAIDKKVDILSGGVYETTDIILKDSVISELSKIPESDYKSFLNSIINRAGYSIYYLEKDNILSETVFEVFGSDFVSKIVRNLAFCGCRLDLKVLIESNSLELFKKFYLSESKSNNALEILFLYDFFINHIALINELYSVEMTEEEKHGFKEYIYHKDKLFKLSNRVHLSRMHEVIYEVNQDVIEEIQPDDINSIAIIKSIIFSTVFGVSYKEIDNLIGIIGNGRIEQLKVSLKDKSSIELLNSFSPCIDFIEKVKNINDIDKLKQLARTINTFYLNCSDRVSKIKSVLSNVDSIVKMLYTEELNDKLYKLPDSGYIELEEDSIFLAHVMNAFGSGSKLSDFKNPRFIGKTYICLTAIGRGVQPYSREEIDMNHVTVLFNKLHSNSLISMSSCDMASYGEIGDMNVSVTNDFNVVEKILKNTGYIPNEYVVYRENDLGESLYPCGILVVGDKPSIPEIEASEYLGVPLVKRKNIERIVSSGNLNGNNDSIEIKNEISLFDSEFYKMIEDELLLIGAIDLTETKK